MNDNSLGGILDIIQPLAPEETALNHFVIVLTLVSLSTILISLALYWWRSPRQRCTRQIDALLHKHSDGQIDAHQAAFELAKIMLERIHYQQLSGNNPIPMHLQQHNSRWQAFVSELNDARYSRSEFNEPAFAKLTSEAIFWVRSW